MEQKQWWDLGCTCAEGYVDSTFAIFGVSVFLFSSILTRYFDLALVQYLGANPGPAIKDCWYYNHKTNTIQAITSIPQPRGGGVLMYSPRQNTLIFTAGAGTFCVEFVGTSKRNKHW